jgi:hypothetical protein
MTNELCKCGKVGKISCPNDERCGAVPTQLPDEVVEQIKKAAKLRLIRNGETSFNRGFYSGEVTGATAYAIQLQQARDLLSNMLRVIEDHATSNEEGLKVINEIKTFLDGAK